MGSGVPFLHSEVVELVADMVARRCRKGEIKQALAELNGGEKVSLATYNRAVSRARALLLISARKTQEDTKSESIALYEQVIRDESAPWPVRMKAQERLDSILGHDARYSPLTGSTLEIAREIHNALDEMDMSVAEEKTNGRLNGTT